MRSSDNIQARVFHAPKNNGREEFLGTITKAYIRAGYSADGARQNASLLMTNYNIQAKINDLKE